MLGALDSMLNTKGEKNQFWICCPILQFKPGQQLVFKRVVAAIAKHDGVNASSFAHISVQIFCLIF